MVVRARRSKSRKRDVERLQVGRLQVRQAVRCGQFKVPLGERVIALRGEEDRDARHQQRLRQPLDDGVEQCPQIGLRVQAAAELDQGLAVVEALLIEDAVDTGLNRPFERIEDEAGDDDRSQKSPRAQAGRLVVVSGRPLPSPR